VLTSCRSIIRPAAEGLARLLLALGFSPDGITLLSFGLSVIFSALLATTGDLLLYIPLIAAAFLLDAVDGTAARLSNRVTPFGGYLDAMCDRLSEAVACLALAIVTEAWLLIFLLAVGSGMFSYAKARAAMEMPVNNANWPDLMERTERCVLMMAIVLSWALFPDIRVGGLDILTIGGSALAALIYVSLLQRVLRARRRLIAEAAAEPCRASPRLEVQPLRHGRADPALRIVAPDDGLPVVQLIVHARELAGSDATILGQVDPASRRSQHIREA
jgi:archaetidylinositol phosphate synthase